MKKYLGVKLIEAEPMTYFEFAKEKYGTVREDAVDSEGYKVKYSDDYVSFSPKEVFEKAYLPLADEEGKKIIEEDVDKFVKEATETKYGERTTLLHATLRNDFIITESSTCVEAENYSSTVGYEVCVDNIRKKIWELLGFVLKWGRNGI